MRFLVLQTRAVGVAWPANASQLWQDTKKWIADLQNKNELEVIYWIPGQGAMAILNLPSHERLAEILQAHPLKPGGMYTVHPLSDIEAFMRQMIGP